MLNLDVRFMRNPKGHKRVHQGRYTNTEAATTNDEHQELEGAKPGRDQVKRVEMDYRGDPYTEYDEDHEEYRLYHLLKPNVDMNLFFMSVETSS